MTAGEKPSKRERAARALRATGLDALLRTVGTWRGTLVLTHHRIGDPAECAVDRRVFSASEAALEAQVAFLARSCEVVGAADRVGDGSSRAGRRVLLTFDDGYRDNYERALPILSAHGVTATFFLTTGFLDGSATPWWDEIAWMVRRSTSTAVSMAPWLPAALPFAAAGREEAIATLSTWYARLEPAACEEFLETLARETGSGRRPRDEARGDFMSWDMARDLRRAGMTLGGHTANHPVLATLPASDQRVEIERGLDRMAEMLGERPSTLAYPVGDERAYDGTTQAAAAASGVRWAFANRGGYARRGHVEPLDVPRLNLEPALSLAHLRAIVALPRWFARP